MCKLGRYFVFDDLSDFEIKILNIFIKFSKGLTLVII